MSEVLILQQGNTAERNPEDDVPCPCPLTACRAFRNKNSGSRAGLLNTGYVQVPSVLLVKVYISPRGRHCPYTHFTDELADGKASGVTWADRAAGRGGAGSSGGRCPDCRTQSATLSDAQIRRQRPGSWATPREESPHTAGMLRELRRCHHPGSRRLGCWVSKQVGRLHFPSLRTWSRHAGQRLARIQSLRLGCSLPTQTQRGDTRGPSPPQRDPPPSLAGHWAQRSGLCSRNSPGPGGSPDPVPSHPRAPTLPMAQQRRGVLSLSGACAS